MGNVLAVAPPSGSWWMRRKRAALPNPGSFDELHKSCKEVFPQQMEGMKLIINKNLSSHFQVSHQVHMSTIGLSGYHFNGKYMGDPQPGTNETFPLLTGDMDNAGSLNAQAAFLLAERVRSKAVFQVIIHITRQEPGKAGGCVCLTSTPCYADSSFQVPHLASRRGV
ncbi:hypothetical protein GDO81_023632 [Engystomops pustulosus]|uniref:Uncharacterized protein n=1 Tax=Engystomops pustulosus TaxID=76066 RepID=A0AAV6ZHH1_ENGPU|nr:hypothetical protein GDO81_023632 [Engystomops pustulosus]KAG8548889.1 hypothetical protein GDO81_023632 [Engystomops pustulosus]